MEYQDIIFYLAWFLGGFITGLSGMGAAMVAIPMLAGIIMPTTLIPVSTIVSFIICVYMSWFYRKSCDYSIIKWLIIGSIPGALVGVSLLLYIDAKYIQILAGVVMLIFVCLQLLRERYVAVVRESSVPKSLLVGFTTGLLSASISIGNPPVAAYAMHLGWAPMQAIANMSIFGFFNLGISCFAQFSAGLYTNEVIKFAIAGGITSIIGVICATPFTKILPARLFKMLVLCIIAFGGATCVWRGFGL